MINNILNTIDMMNITVFDYSQKLSKSIIYRVMAKRAIKLTIYLGIYKFYTLVFELINYTISSM